MNEISEIVASVKAQIKDNDGELGYWGPALQLKSSSPTANADLGSKLAEPKVDSRIRGNDGTEDSLRRLREETIGDCHLCPLGDTRTKIVFGVGNPKSGVLFVGEGPGFDEDRIGDPFVGKAGQLLDRILAAIHLDRTKVYIANIVKCHPMVDPSQPEKRGNDRPPTPEEMAKCLPFLKEQIKIMQPKIIVALGATAVKALLNRNVGITAVRGKMTTLNIGEDAGPIPLLPTFHPAALLRDESLKKFVWEDMKLLRKILSE